MKRLIAIAALAVLGAAAGAGEEGFQTKAYDVSSFTGWEGHRVPRPRLGPSPSLWDGDEEDVGEGYLPLPLERLVDLIRMGVSPSSWERGGRIWAEGAGTIFVSNHPVVHREVEALLAEIGAAASRRALVAVEAWSLPREKYLEAAGAADPAAVDFAALGAERLESASVEAWPGVRTVLKVTNRVRYMQDYDVEIAQGANISDPVVDVAEEGLAAEIYAHPTLDGTKVLVEAVVQSGRFERPMRKVRLGVDEEYLPEPYRSEARSTIGTLELPRYRLGDTYATRLVPSGKSFLLPLLSEDRCVVLVFRAEALGPAGGGRLLDTGALTRLPNLCVFGLPDVGDAREQAMVAPRLFPLPDERVPLLSIETLAGLPDSLEMLRPGAGTVTAEGNGFLLVNGQAELRDWLRAMVGEREQELIRPVSVDLSVWSTPAAPPVGEGKSVGPEQGELLFAAGLSTVSGRPTGFMTGDTMNYLADYDVEVAQEARIADPIVGQSFAGVLANVRPVLTTDGTRVRIGLNLLLARRGEIEAFPTGAQYLGTVEIFDEKRTVLNTLAETALGVPYTIDAGPDPRDPARRIAVVLRAVAQ